MTTFDDPRGGISGGKRSNFRPKLIYHIGTNLLTSKSRFLDLYNEVRKDRHTCKLWRITHVCHALFGIITKVDTVPKVQVGEFYSNVCSHSAVYVCFIRYIYISPYTRQIPPIKVNVRPAFPNATELKSTPISTFLLRRLPKQSR